MERRKGSRRPVSFEVLISPTLPIHSSFKPQI